MRKNKIIAIVTALFLLVCSVPAIARTNTIDKNNIVPCVLACKYWDDGHCRYDNYSSIILGKNYQYHKVEAPGVKNVQYGKVEGETCYHYDAYLHETYSCNCGRKLPDKVTYYGHFHSIAHL